MRPRALDLFCGGGGASMGLHRAGFDVTGIDIRPQPRYPFAFVQADALRPPVDLGAFDFIWASPPCQRWTPHAKQHASADSHPDHIEHVREMLQGSGVQFCIENVRGSPVRAVVVLTGCMFGLRTYRKRHFETSAIVLAPQPGRPFGPKTGGVTVTGHSGGRSRRSQWQNGDGAAWQAAMGIDWMTNAEMAQAVPPAYAEFIARAMMFN